MYADQQNKTCMMCKEEQSIDNFHFRSKKKNHKSSYCKSCCKKRASEYRQKNKVLIKKRAFDYYQKNKDWINPSRYEYNKNYRLSNPDKAKFWQRDWREKNYEFSLELHKRYYRKNKGKRQANSRKYALSKKNATPKWLTKEHLDSMSLFYTTRPEGYHVDHIVPICGKDVCGLHVPWNLQFLPAKENLRKNNFFDFEAAGNKG